MSISIRLAKFGKRNQPSYRIVVANTKDKRNGRFLDLIGHYNPSENPVKFEYNKDKFAEWSSKGALISETVSQLIAGTYKQKPRDPQGKLAKEQVAAK